MGVPVNFGGLTEEDLSHLDSPPRFSVLPVPYDRTASYVSGASAGPKAIIEASTHMELYDEELKSEPYKAGIETRAALECSTLVPEETVARVREAATEIIETGAVPVLLGGEHSVTLGLVQALLKKYPGLSVLALDAHADMRDVYDSTPFSHACIARRISELCPVVGVGIRSMSAAEARFLKGASGVETIYAADMTGALDTGRLLRGLTDTVFITVDLDVFDPSVMPATGTPEPGGLLWRDVLAVVRETISARKVVGFDVVELCPIPGLVAPDFLAARLVYRMMGYINEKTGYK